MKVHTKIFLPLEKTEITAKIRNPKNARNSAAYQNYALN